MFIVHVHVHVKHGSIEDFMQATIENARSSVQEPGIARFDVVQQQDDATRLALLLRLVSARPATVLFVTHDLTEAVELADRILVLSASPGQVVAEMPIAVPRERRRLAALRSELARLAGHPAEPCSLSDALR